jgi:hypothetical protein
MSVNSLNTFLNIRDAHLRVVSGNVHATAMNIGGINVDVAHGLQSVTNQGNVTSNTLQFSNATTAFVTTANVTVGRDLTVTGNALVSSNLTVTGNVTVSDDLTVTENLFVSNNLTVTKDVTVTGNTFYTNPMSISVDSNVVAEYTGPHDRPLRKYPEVAFPTQTSGGIGDTTVTYNGYTLTSSTTYGFTNHNLTNALDGLTNTAWSGLLGNYDTSGVPVSGTRGGLGDYIQLELPNAIKIQRTKIFSQITGGYSNGPRNITLYGSNDGTNWTSIKVATDLPLDGDKLNATVHINSITFYKYFRLEINKIWIDSAGATYPRIAEWELYGHEEGDSSLDTTLKSVYNVPGTQQLEVYYDAKDLTAMPSTVTDLAGGDQNGTVTGATLDETGGIESFNFDGSNDIIQGTFSGHTVSSGYTMATWIKPGTIGDDDYIATFGVGNTGTSIGINFETIGGAFRAFVWGSSSAVAQTSDNVVHKDQWVHVAATFISSGGIINLYINNKLAATGSGTTLSSISASAPLVLGARNSNGTIERHANFKMANFRLFSKALNAEQVRELYDYQKDYFLGTRSSVTLYKGHLGIGVAEPSGQLELAGDERIQQYPPRGMTDFDTYIEGHGVFTASASSNFGSYNPWEAFDDNNPTGGNTGAGHGWASHITTGSGNAYDTGTGLEAQSVTHHSGSAQGEWIQIELPHGITLSSFDIESRAETNYSGNMTGFPKNVILYGSTNGSSWGVVKDFTTVSKTAGAKHTEAIISSTAYKYYALVIESIHVSGTDVRFTSIGQLRLFGTPGPTTLDKGSLTLGRSLDVPRISRYDVDTETPRPEKLVVDFDTTVNSSPTDISGKGNHGAFYNGASYSAADKAFNFDGSSNQYIQGNLNNTGDIDFSISTWLRRDSLDAGFPFSIGTISGAGTGMAFDIYASGGSLYFWVNGGTMLHDTDGATQFPAKTWVHVVATRTGTTLKVYLNGVDWTSNMVVMSNGSATLSLPANAIISLGRRQGSATTDFTGQISNFKLYNVVLEASEVQKLYRLGRTGRSMVISDTAVGIGKVPEAQLDVRGNLKVSGTVQVPMIIAHRYINGSVTTVTNGNYIPFNGVIYDNPPGLHNGNYFTCPVKGIYECHADMLVNNSGQYDGNHEWHVNNAVYSVIRLRGYGTQVVGNKHNQATSHYYIEANAGDTIALKGVSTIVWYGSNTYAHAHMSIRLITPI